MSRSRMTIFSPKRVGRTETRKSMSLPPPSFTPPMLAQGDCVLAMYHDQGLAPFKAVAFDTGVNYTAGLPVIRTSPAHGTAYAIAGEDKASPESFRQAMFLAIDVFKSRILYDEISKNPLKSYHFNPNQVDESINIEEEDEQI